MTDADADIYPAVLRRLAQRSNTLVAVVERACRELPVGDPEVNLIIRSLRLALVKFNEDGDS